MHEVEKRFIEKEEGFKRAMKKDDSRNLKIEQVFLVIKINNDK